MKAGTIAKVSALPAFWVLTAVMMARDWASDPYDPTLEGTARYGHNHEGALGDGLVLTLVELAVLVAILRPWSYDRSWGRSLAAVMLLAPWTFVSMLMSMHQGSVVVIHFMWLFVLLVGLGITFLISIVSHYRSIGRRG